MTVLSVGSRALPYPLSCAPSFGWSDHPTPPRGGLAACREMRDTLHPAGHAAPGAARCWMPRHQGAAAAAAAAKGARGLPDGSGASSSSGSGSSSAVGTKERWNDAPQTPFNTGTMDISTGGATAPRSSATLLREKSVVVVRHGLTTFNEQGRIQGASNESRLTGEGRRQARRCRDALARVPFDECFCSPLTRARETAGTLWEGRQGALHFEPCLREMDLGYLQGVRNDVAAIEHAAAYRCWRETPADFVVDGRRPLAEAFAAAEEAWARVLDCPGDTVLVITHKSILRAFVCVALGLPPSSFRAVDVNNGGVSQFRVNKRGEPMLVGLNHTSHLHAPGVYY